ncbi:EH domain-containing protein 4 [Grus japonensis]|uniref:EH domain-containing protein 4 n=1 Tax=Grus japonensis TaxID=30415 RepID=A0ABC9WPN9_GRUJA
MEDPTPEQVEAPEGGCDPVGSPRWSKFLAGPVDLWREDPTLEQFAPEGLHPVRGTPCWSRGTMRGVLRLRMKKRQKHREMN